MNDNPVSSVQAVEALLRSLEEAKQHLLDIVAQLTDQEFAWQTPAGDSVQETLEKASDDLAFSYAWLVTRVRGLRPIPCLRSAEFSSIQEASMSLQVAHLRLGNMLHDLQPQELGHLAEQEEAEPLSLGHILEMAVQHYRDWAARVEDLRQAFREVHR
jgi:hypothetical protein